MIINLLFWYFVIVLLGWLCFPISYRLFSRLPDRGYSFSRILGLLIWGFIFWSMCSLGLLQNSPGAILLAIIIVLGLSVWSGWHQWGEIWAWLKAHQRYILMIEALFLVGFVFMSLVRSSDPSATGTEKPMELAFINAILNSKTFPPHDPWLSGYAISYYHFGYILVAMLAKLTFTSGGVAFNLMLASIFGMSAVGAYGILYNLIKNYRSKFTRDFNALSWALLGPIFLLFISNLEVLLEMAHQAGLGWDFATNTSKFWQWVNIESLLSPPNPPLTFIPQRFWWWWQASRVVHDIDLLGNVSALSPIDEFPAFSFVLGDLHPHVLVMPFVMLVIGLAFQIFLGGMDERGKIFNFTLPYPLDSFMVSAVLMGGIAFLNTWDLPVYFVLLVGAYFLRQILTKGWHWERIFELLTLAIPLGVSAIVLYLPFFISFQSQAGGILPNIVYPTRGLYFWVMFGTLFLPLLLFFGWLRKKRFPIKWQKGAILIALLIALLYLISVSLGFLLSRTAIGQQFITSQGQSSAVGLLIAAVRHRLSFGFGLLTLAAILTLGLSYLLGSLRKTEDEDRGKTVIIFVLLQIVLGGVMVLAPEFVYLQDSFGARMNTIFKFYYQAWMLWSISAGFGAVIIFNSGKWFSKLILSLFILLGLLYPTFAFIDKTEGFNPANGYTLDASAYFEDYQPDEAAAIAWLKAAPQGVVAEAIGGQYSAYARVSTLSGKPTVLGWPGHEGQWRGGYEEVGSRESDVRQLYETSNWQSALEIIQRYDIRYIYIGSLEMNTYGVNAIKFEQFLDLGFEQGAVRVFIVSQID